MQTDGRTEICNYRVASQQNKSSCYKKVGRLKDLTIERQICEPPIIIQQHLSCVD